MDSKGSEPIAFKYFARFEVPEYSDVAFIFDLKSSGDTSEERKANAEMLFADPPPLFFMIKGEIAFSFEEILFPDRLYPIFIGRSYLINSSFAFQISFVSAERDTRSIYIPMLSYIVPCQKSTRSLHKGQVVNYELERLCKLVPWPHGKKEDLIVTELNAQFGGPYKFANRRLTASLPYHIERPYRLNLEIINYKSEIDPDFTPMNWSYADRVFMITTLNDLRIHAASEVLPNGARVMVIGPHKSDKSNLINMITNNAFRSKFKPMLIDLDLEQGTLGLPGMIGVDIISNYKGLEPEAQWEPNRKLPKLLHFGSRSQEVDIERWNIVSRAISSLERESRLNMPDLFYKTYPENKKIFHSQSGLVVRANCWPDGLEHLLQLACNMEMSHIYVVGDLQLFHEVYHHVFGVHYDANGIGLPVTHHHFQRFRSPALQHDNVRYVEDDKMKLIMAPHMVQLVAKDQFNRRMFQLMGPKCAKVKLEVEKHTFFRFLRRVDEREMAKNANWWQSRTVKVPIRNSFVDDSQVNDSVILLALDESDSKEMAKLENRRLLSILRIRMKTIIDAITLKQIPHLHKLLEVEAIATITKVEFGEVEVQDSDSDIEYDQQRQPMKKIRATHFVIKLPVGLVDELKIGELVFLLHDETITIPQA